MEERFDTSWLRQQADETTVLGRQVVLACDEIDDLRAKLAAIDRRQWSRTKPEGEQWWAFPSHNSWGSASVFLADKHHNVTYWTMDNPSWFLPYEDGDKSNTIPVLPPEAEKER